MAEKSYYNITRDTQRGKKFFEDKVAYTMSPMTLHRMLDNLDKENIYLVDVRRKEDYEKGHIKNAVSIPGSEIENRLNELSKDKINLLYCYTQQCHLAATAALVLAENGYPVIELEGGFDVWKHGYKYEVVT